MCALPRPSEDYTLEAKLLNFDSSHLRVFTNAQTVTGTSAMAFPATITGTGTAATTTKAGRVHYHPVRGAL